MATKPKPVCQSGPQWLKESSKVYPDRFGGRQISLAPLTGQDYAALRTFLHALELYCIFEWQCEPILPCGTVDGHGAEQSVSNSAEVARKVGGASNRWSQDTNDGSPERVDVLPPTEATPDSESQSSPAGTLSGGAA